MSVHKLAVKDNISDAENPEKQVTDLIDQIVKQIGTDVEKQIAKKFEEIKQIGQDEPFCKIMKEGRRIRA